MLPLTMLVAAIFTFSFGSQARIDEALLTGQRLEISLSTGEIYGKILQSEESQAKALAEAATIEKSKKEEEAKSKFAEVLPWMEKEFIGPKMPEEMVAIIVGDDIKTELKLQEVSLKELGDKPIIVIIIKGLGLSASTTEHALELPTDVTLGFSPYSPSIEEWVAKAQELGHEIVLNIPMETKDYNLNDPGPYALITNSSKEDNITRLKMLLSLVKGYKAVYSETEEVFTQSMASVKPILESLKDEGKYFIYGGGYSDYSLIQIADGIEYPLLINDITLDDEISSRSINDKILEIENHAKEQGYAVVMAHPYPITIRMLEMWLPQLKEKGFKIAPVSLLLGKSIVK